MPTTLKKRQQLSSNSRNIDVSHMTRPKLDPLVQQTLESVGMRTRKAFSDGAFQKQMAEPKAQHAMKLAFASASEIRKPLPYYENKSAKDPWAEFRAAGQKKSSYTTRGRIYKRGRDDDDDDTENFPNVMQELSEPKTALHASISSPEDPNDLEFTNPPWLASQESLQSDEEMVD